MMKKEVLALTAGMLIGGLLFLIGICSVHVLGNTVLIMALVGIMLTLGCSVRLECVKNKHHITTRETFVKLLKS